MTSDSFEKTARRLVALSSYGVTALDPEGLEMVTKFI